MKRKIFAVFAGMIAVVSCAFSFVACDDGQPEPHRHSYHLFASNHDATCTEDGTETGICMYCDETYVRVARGTKVGHYFEYVYNNDATCSEDGTETGECSRCHETIPRNLEGSATGEHVFIN